MPERVDGTRSVPSLAASTRGLNPHHAPESGIETLRTRCIPVRATSRRFSHPHIRSDGLQRQPVYSVNGTFTWSYPFEIALPVRQPEGHGLPVPLYAPAT